MTTSFLTLTNKIILIILKNYFSDFSVVIRSFGLKSNLAQFTGWNRALKDDEEDTRVRQLPAMRRKRDDGDQEWGQQLTRSQSSSKVAAGNCLARISGVISATPPPPFPLAAAVADLLKQQLLQVYCDPSSLDRAAARCGPYHRSTKELAHKWFMVWRIASTCVSGKLRVLHRCKSAITAGNVA